MNGYLLDTNAMLFLAFKRDALESRRVDALGDAPRFISQVCAIEIAIKYGLGKLALPPSYLTNFATGFSESVRELAADILAIDLSHVDILSRLPQAHRDHSTV